MTEREDIFERAEKRIGSVVRAKYHIDQLLGIGGMAAVYAATHRNRRRFAVKILHPELSVQPNVRKRFVREGYIANLVDHPGVVTVLDDDVTEDGSAYLVMELLDGVGVEKLCGELGETVPVREVLCIAHQLLAVLAAAHAKSVVHRDIKPGNLFVERDGQVKVLDFGIARLKEAATELKLTRTGARMGTPAFMSPEQAMAKAGDIDACTDIWSVGATLFRMLSGQYVHLGENASQVAIHAATKPARSLGSVAPDLPPEVIALVDRALAFEKAARFESAAVMGDAVRTVYEAFYGTLSSDTLASFIESRYDSLTSASRRDAKEELSSRTDPETDDSDAAPVEDTSKDAVSPPSSPPQIAASKPPRQMRRLVSILVGLVALGAVLALGALTMFSSEPAPGKLTVTATTDMLVPTDVDWLAWTIESTDKQQSPIEGAVALTDWKTLPVTLAEISAGDRTGTLRLKLTARRGGRAGEIIVKRDLVLEVPEKGDKQHNVALDWLCSEGALSTPCKKGEACRAGACISAKSLTATPQLAPQSAPRGRCFDTMRCFASGVVITVPPIDPVTGHCILNQTHALMSAERKNLALVVNTSVMGNFGVCGPAGQCLIPIDQGGPTGWEILKDKGVVTGIRLPSAVCRDISLGKLRGVALAPAIPGCPPKSSSTPLCAAPDTCVATPDICPKDLPAAWGGFTCSGAASPQMLRKDLIGCFIPPREPSATQKGASPSGQWCCTTGERPGTDPLLIDDMSGGPQLKLVPPQGFRGGMWWTASDAKSAELSPPPNPGLFTLTKIDPPVTTAEGNTFDRAACFSSPGFNGWIALMGFNFISAKDDAMAPPFDLSPYTGIRFWGYSPGRDQNIKVAFADRNTYTEDARSTCNQNPKDGRCGDDWGIQRLTLTPTWKEFVVKWKDLKQSPVDWEQARYASFDPTHVYTAYFAVNGQGEDKRAPSFEFCVSQIYFTQ